MRRTGPSRRAETAGPGVLILQAVTGGVQPGPIGEFDIAWNCQNGTVSGVAKLSRTCSSVRFVGKRSLFQIRRLARNIDRASSRLPIALPQGGALRLDALLEMSRIIERIDAYAAELGALLAAGRALMIAAPSLLFCRTQNPLSPLMQRR